MTALFSKPFEFLTNAPTDSLEMRHSLYAGTIYLLPPNEASSALVEHVLLLLIDEFGPEFRTVQFRISGEEFFKRIGRLRKLIYTEESIHHAIDHIISSLGFRREEHAYDSARLRVITHRGHENRAAAPIYYGHRDTWYSNPQGMVTWWIPLHDVAAEESFDFFPEDFARPVANDSEKFDFGSWVAKGQEKRIGWQKADTGLTAVYPQLREQPQGQVLPVVAKKGEILLFAGQHLHQTRQNMTGRTRFSLDFRTVHLADHAAGIAAVNVDNRSTGTSLSQFVYAADASSNHAT